MIGNYMFFVSIIGVVISTLILDVQATNERGFVFVQIFGLLGWISSLAVTASILFGNN